MDEPDPRPVAPGGLGLYVRLDDVEEGQLVTDVREADWSEELPVALGPLGRWMSLGDAIENSGRVRDALLRISPDERVERGMRLRALALGAPVAFAFFAVNEIQETGQVASDAKRVLGSEAFRAAETDSDPRVVQFAKTRREKIERAVGMRWGTVTIEAASRSARLSGIRRVCGSALQGNGAR